jgi:hypothetical protein
LSQVDWDAVAERAGYGSANSAKVRYGQIKKALGYNEDGTFSATVTPTKPRGPRVKKDKATVGSGTNDTPSKVVKKRTPKKKVVKEAEPEAEEEVEATMNDVPAYEDAHEDGHQNGFSEEMYE